MVKTGVNKNLCVAVGTVMLFVTCFAFATPVAGTSGNQPGSEIIPPTIESTEESVSFEDIVPGDIRMMEDYSPPFETDLGPEPMRLSIWRVMGSLALVVLLIVGVVYVMRMMMARGIRYDMKGRHIRVMDMMQLGANRGLYLVEVGGKTVLLGSTEKGLSFLTEVNIDPGAESEEPGYTEEGGVGFGDTLRQAVSAPADRGATAPSAARDQTPDDFMQQIKEKLRRLEEEQGRG